MEMSGIVERLLLQPLDEVLGDGKLPDEPIELGIHGGLEHLVGGEGFGCRSAIRLPPRDGRRL